MTLCDQRYPKSLRKIKLYATLICLSPVCHLMPLTLYLSPYDSYLMPVNLCQKPLPGCQFNCHFDFDYTFIDSFDLRRPTRQRRAFAAFAAIGVNVGNLRHLQQSASTEAVNRCLPFRPASPGWKARKAKLVE